MRITDVKASVITSDMYFLGNPLTITVVQVLTDEEITGVGCTSFLCSNNTNKTYIEEVLRRLIINKDPFDTERIWKTMYNTKRILSGTEVGISCLEIALWDIIGKAVKKPVYKLLGGFQDQIIAYASQPEPPRGMESPEYCAQFTLDAINNGFKVVKLHIGNDAKADKEIVKSIRDTVGYDVDIIVDVVGRYSHQTAFKMLSVYEKYEILFLEEPLPSNDLDGLSALANKSTIPLSGGENLFGIYEFKEALVKGSYDIVQPDASRNGGLSQGKSIGMMAEAWNKWCIPHAYGNDAIEIANLHLAASLPNCPYFEFAGCRPPFSRKGWGHMDVTDYSLKVEDGYVKVPNRPGLGFNLRNKLA